MSEKSVDHLIQALQKKRQEFQALGSTLRESARPVVVCFVDLTDSTAIKTSFAPDEWLGYIYEFLSAVASQAQGSGGTIIKRIGDEVMVSFPDTKSSEQFLDGLQADSSLRPGSFKASLDYGEAYYLRFSEGLEDDPYGTVVDRCARLANLARPGAVLCSAAYQRKVGGAPYVSAGTFSLKGLTEPEEVFIRQPLAGSEEYLKPLLDALNEPSGKSESYTSIPRRFDEVYLASLGHYGARPFMARALLNVPRLADSPRALEQRLKGANGEQELKRLRGYFIDWVVSFRKYEVETGEIRVYASIPENKTYDQLWVRLVPSMLEIVQTFTVGQRLRLRGILMQAYIMMFQVNYADFEVLDESDLLLGKKQACEAAVTQASGEIGPTKKPWWRFWG
jgi:class 3 adenylate cyclase